MYLFVFRIKPWSVLSKVVVFQELEVNSAMKVKSAKERISPPLLAPGCGSNS